MSFIPLLLSAAPSLLSGLDRAFDSPEQNFKNDLGQLLEQAGVPEETVSRIAQLLNTGSNQEIGVKINALMSLGLIPPGLADQIAELALKDGVPSSSLDPLQCGEPMSPDDRDGVLGGAFPDEVDAKRAEEDGVEGADGEAAEDGEDVDSEGEGE